MISFLFNFNSHIEGLNYINENIGFSNTTGEVFWL